MKIRIPVPYPLTDTNEGTIRRGLNLASEHENPELLLFHLNELQTDQRIRRKTLRNAVESACGEIDASYVVRDGCLIEEAIIEETIRLEMDYLILSRRRRNRRRQLLREILELDRDPDRLIEERTGITVEIGTILVPSDVNDP